MYRALGVTHPANARPQTLSCLQLPAAAGMQPVLPPVLEETANTPARGFGSRGLPLPHGTTGIPPPPPSHPPTCRPRVVGDGDRVPVLLGVDGEEPHAEAAVVGEGSAVVKVLQVDAELVAALHRQHVDPLQPCGRGRGGVGGPRRGWGGWEPLGRGHGVGQGAVPTLQPSLLLPHG